MRVEAQLAAMHREDSLLLNRALFDQSLALVSAHWLDKKDFEPTQNQAIDLWYRMQDDLHPGSYLNAAERKQAGIYSLMRRWESNFGDLNDPAVQAKAQSVADALEKCRLETAAENAQQGNRRILTKQERYERRRQLLQQPE